MPLPCSIEEPVLVQARFLPDGVPEPEMFSWQDRIYRIVSAGRRWHEPQGDARWSCYLVTADDSQTYELRLDLAEKRWYLWRYWPRIPAA